MIRALAERNLAVVATNAALGDTCVIKMGDLPLLSRVTGITRGVGHNVGSRLSTRTYVIVTTGAFTRGALEHTTFVAGLATSS
ncbi:MAG: hypothetical protein RLZZ366_1794 [Pseudomonadota bacterium]